MHTAIILTLDENGHLADGDNCTLKALKAAVEEVNGRPTIVSGKA